MLLLDMSEYLVICKPMFFGNHPMCGDAIKIYCAMFLCNVFVYCHCRYLYYVLVDMNMFKENVIRTCNNVCMYSI